MDSAVMLSLVAMVVVFCLVYFLPRRKVEISIALIACSVAGALAGGVGFPIRHLVEGEFGYFNVVLVIITGSMFLGVMQKNGILRGITRGLARRLCGHPFLLLLLSVVLLFLPGTVTGLGVPAVLSTGVLVIPILKKMGMDDATLTAFIAIEACFGTVTGPVNIPVMIIANAINMPYEGFSKVLPLMTISLGLITMLILGSRTALNADIDAVMEEFRTKSEEIEGARAYIPILLVIALFVIPSLFPLRIPALSTPVVFMIGMVAAVLCGKRINILQTLGDAINGPILSVAALLIAVGVVVQISTLTGVKGVIVVGSLSLSKAFIIIALAVILPIFGGVVTMLGAAAILGVPLVLALLGHNVIIVTAAVSLICALSQVIPPTAIVGLLAGDIVGMKGYGRIMKKLLLPCVIAIVFAIMMIFFANQLAQILI